MESASALQHAQVLTWVLSKTRKLPAAILPLPISDFLPFYVCLYHFLWAQTHFHKSGIKSWDETTTPPYICVVSYKRAATLPQASKAVEGAMSRWAGTAYFTLETNIQYHPNKCQLGAIGSPASPVLVPPLPVTTPKHSRREMAWARFLERIYTLFLDQSPSRNQSSPNLSLFLCLPGLHHNMI